MAIPHTKFQAMMAPAPAAFHASLIRASSLPVMIIPGGDICNIFQGWRISPSSMKIGAAMMPMIPPPPWIATASTGSSTPMRRINLERIFDSSENEDDRIFTWKGRHRPLQQSMQLWQWPRDNIHCTQHRLRPFLRNNNTLKSRDQIILQIPMRHPFITFSKDHFPPGIILLTKRTVVPATQQDT